MVVCSGRTRGFSVGNRQRLVSVVEDFHPHREPWEATQITGESPAPDVCDTASESLDGELFMRGGLWTVNTLRWLGTKTLV